MAQYIAQGFSQSDNTEIIINDRANEVIKELSKYLRYRRQINLKSIKGSDLCLIMFIYCNINIIK